jgi:hypothetical protein
LAARTPAYRFIGKMEAGDVFNYVYVLEQYQVLCCRLCSTAIRPRKGIEGHFRGEHGLRGPVLKEVMLLYGDSDLADPATAALPADGSRLPEFPVSQGFSCNDCRFFTKAYDNIVRHRRGAGHTSPNGWSKVSIQAWSRGRYARYWRVDPEEDSGQQGFEPKSLFEQSVEGVEDVLRSRGYGKVISKKTLTETRRG